MSSNMNILNPTSSCNDVFNFASNFNHLKNCKFYLLTIFILDIPFSFNQKLRKSSDICSICLDSITFASKIDLCSHIFSNNPSIKGKKLIKYVHYAGLHSKKFLVIPIVKNFLLIIIIYLNTMKIFQCKKEKSFLIS